MRPAIFLSVVLTACASGPAVPDWQANAKSRVDHAISAYFAGNDRVAAQEFAGARNDMASTGQATLVARIELIKCAGRIASLVLDECTEFEKLRQDSAAPERAYADYLAGRVQAQDVAQLPAPHQAVSRADAHTAAKAIDGIDDPFSRLVAAGTLLRTGRAGPVVIASAVETASAQGWRRPLLAWLGVQVKRAEQAGDAQEAQRLRRRMDLVQGTKP
ncbi:MAG: hypothetical protein HYS18_04625 [Burkholderiales bacterium]|nr:hypothetical protein [Burkholderiales bacterium]